MRPDGNRASINWRTETTKKELKPINFNRGVAKLVSRQFRVLETVGSSPATSTIKNRQPLRLPVFYVCGASARTRLAQQDASSHIPPKDLKARFQGAGRGYIRHRRKSRYIILRLPRVLRRLDFIVLIRRSVNLRSSNSLKSSGAPLRPKRPFLTVFFHCLRHSDFHNNLDRRALFSRRSISLS